jgi:hypothetical protein
MIPRAALLCFFFFVLPALNQTRAQPGELPKDLQIILKQGSGTAEGRAAWERVVAAGPRLLPRLLEAMDGANTPTTNWLRTAFDRILDRERKAGGNDIDADVLLAFVRDARHSGRARRLALEVVEQLRRGTSERLYAGWLEDPEFRYEAVERALAEAKKLTSLGRKQEASAAFRKALAASRDMMQGRAAAAGLQKLGVQLSVAEHLGFLVDWYVVGPFDAKGMKGFHIEYAPEKGVDLAAEYDGQGGKVRWKRYRVQEPLPTSGGRHQALVDLRDREALGDADDAVAFAYTEFAVPTTQEVEFCGAADDNFTVWVNGQRVFGFEEYRNGVRLDRHRFKVKLREGGNTVLVKVCQTPAPNPEPNWEFFLRVVDSTGKGIAMTNHLPRSGKPEKSP